MKIPTEIKYFCPKLIMISTDGILTADSSELSRYQTKKSEGSRVSDYSTSYNALPDVSSHNQNGP